jgi:hypothetical protein
MKILNLWMLSLSLLSNGSIVLARRIAEADEEEVNCGLGYVSPPGGLPQATDAGCGCIVIKDDELTSFETNILAVDMIDLGFCEGFAIMATSSATCAGAAPCGVLGGTIGAGVTGITGSFVGDSTLVCTVLAGSAITIQTNGKILGRAIAQTAVTCETSCTVETSARQEVSKILNCNNCG